MVSISGITAGLKTVYGYGKRALEVAPELAFGTASEAVGKAMKAKKGSVFKKAEAGWKALEKAGSGNFFKNFIANAKKFLPEAIDAFKSGTGFKGKFGELFKNLGSKMPFIMSASWILMEIPNVWTATKEKGIFQGAAEVLKFGARMTTAGLGSAIGAALPIPGGSIIGWIAGEWIASRIVGKSYTEQKAEKEELIKELTGQDASAQTPAQNQQPQIQQPQAPNPYWLNNNQTAYNPQQPSFNGNMTNPFDYNQYKLQGMPYANDIMMQKMPFNVMA
jgi:hypothetical protein